MTWIMIDDELHNFDVYENIYTSFSNEGGIWEVKALYSKPYLEEGYPRHLVLKMFIKEEEAKRFMEYLHEKLKKV